MIVTMDRGDQVIGQRQLVIGFPPNSKMASIAISWGGFFHGVIFRDGLGLFLRQAGRHGRQIIACYFGCTQNFVDRLASLRSVQSPKHCCTCTTAAIGKDWNRIILQNVAKFNHLFVRNLTGNDW